MTSVSQRRRFRRAVEALRFGVVPSDALEELTLDFAGLHRWVLSRLPLADGDRPQLTEVEGAFGSGKSHTMALVRYIAQREGYVTAHVEVDGQSITLIDPRRLMFALWSTLRGREFASSTPLVDLFERAIAAGHAPPEVVGWTPDKVEGTYSAMAVMRRYGLLDAYRPELEEILAGSPSQEMSPSELASAVWAEIRGAPFEDKRLVRFWQMGSARAVADRPFEFVATLVGYAEVAKLAGFAGLVVTIDEFEVQERFLQPRDWPRLYAVLDCLRDYFRGEVDIAPAPLALFVATVPDSSHEGSVLIRDIAVEAGGASLALREPNEDAMLILAQRLYWLYEQAYRMRVPFDRKMARATLRSLGPEVLGESGLVRAFTRRVIAALDRDFGPAVR